MTSHKDCTHPSTKAARSACRRGIDSTMTVRDNAVDSQIRARNGKAARAAKAKVNATVDEGIAKRCAHLSRDADGLCLTCGDQLSELNTKRLRATRAAAAAKQGPRGECHICGGKAGWVDNKSKEPVCMKHVDYDNCKIIVL